MEYEIDDAVALLERTPGVLRAWLLGLPEVWASAQEGPEAWTPREVIAHMAWLDEFNWLGRAEHILEYGEDRPFEPLDREGFREWMTGRSVGDILDAFEARRRVGVDRLRASGWGAEEFSATGSHPTLGVVKLSQLLAAWASHDMTHIVQIARTFGRQYEEATGPWTQFMSIFGPTT